MLVPTQLQDVVELHKQLVCIPSLSREEGDIADFLMKYVSGQSDILLSRTGNNVLVQLGDGPRTLLLNTHLDVVPPSAGHPYHPFTATEHEGAIYGRGSVDAKASVASMLTSLLSLHEGGYRPVGGKIVLALTVCEELGGTENGLETMLPLLPHIDAALIGEPTMMQPCIAQKGLLILKMISRGRTAHAARATLGINAIEICARDITILGGLNFDRIHPELGAITLTPTTIEGGAARNVVPETCTVFLDIRSTPSYSHRELIDLIAAEVESEIHVHSDRLVSVGTDRSESIVQASISAHPGAVPFGSPTLSDWFFLQGTPAVKMGPGDSRLSHTANEHVSVDQLRLAVDVYQNAIQSYFEIESHKNV